jgi:hypothetical protein
MTSLSATTLSASTPFHSLAFGPVTFSFLFGAGRSFKKDSRLLTNRAWFNPKPTGYRHVRLLSNLGEALENTTLFVHVAVSEKWAGEVLDFQYFLYLYASFCFKMFE